MAINQMPHNLDAEAALLGCILLDGDIQAELMEQLREGDFYQESHRVILAAMKAVYGNRKPIDLVTLKDELDRMGKLDDAGGAAYLAELATLMPSAANYKQYFEILRRDSTHRALIRAAQDIIKTSMKGQDENEALAFAEKAVFDISKNEDNAELKGLADGSDLKAVLESLEEISADPNSQRGLPTGFKHLDRITGGLQKGNLIVLAARPGMGKSSLAMNIVEHAALQKGKICAVFSLEMPREEIVQRLLCAYAGVSMEKALAGKLGHSEWRNLLLASDRLQKSSIYIDDTPRMSAPTILSRCRRLAAQAGGLDLVVVDHIQLMKGEGKSERGEVNRTLELGRITGDLKIMAKELRVPVIALSQLRRIQTKEPQLDDLRESGSIEQDADIVMFINRPEVTATAQDVAAGKIVKGATELVIAKNRNGAQGRIQLRFIGERTKFVDVEDQNLPTEQQTHARPAPEKNPTAEEAFPPQDDEELPYD